MNRQCQVVYFLTFLPSENHVGICGVTLGEVCGGDKAAEKEISFFTFLQGKVFVALGKHGGINRKK